MLAREIAGLVALATGAVIAIVGFVAASWWSLVILGGSALAVGGLMAAVHRTPEVGDEDAAPH